MQAPSSERQPGILSLDRSTSLFQFTVSNLLYGKARALQNVPCPAGFRGMASVRLIVSLHVTVTAFLKQSHLLSYTSDRAVLAVSVCRHIHASESVPGLGDSGL